MARTTGLEPAASAVTAKSFKIAQDTALCGLSCGLRIQSFSTIDIQSTPALLDPDNFRVVRDSLSIGRKRQWRFQILRTGLTTRSDRCTSPFPTCRCPKSLALLFSM
jgi:hypothetical protein